MLYPSIDKILNIVDSKYALVHIASKRSKEMHENNNYQLDDYGSERGIGKALEEIVEGVLTVEE